VTFRGFAQVLFDRKKLRLLVLTVVVSILVLLSWIAYVNQGSFDFRLSNSGSSSNLGGVVVVPGGAASVAIRVSLVSGLSQTVELSCSSASGPLPPGVSCSFSPRVGSPTFTSTLRIETSSSTRPGYYTIKVIATAGGITHATLFTLVVT
jgi:hypothetical protein